MLLSMKLCNLLIWLILMLMYVRAGTKVIELSDRFIELRGESTWMIKFYAPWCGHCKKLEPIWSHVAQALSNTEIRVGRVDCTRFTAMTAEFNIKGFPTIMYVKGDTQYTFRGDRTKEELIGFALRMVDVPVPHIEKSKLDKSVHDNLLFFLYVGDRNGTLWDCFHSHALEYRHFHYFFSADVTAVQHIIKEASDPSVFIFKDHSHIQFSAPLINEENDDMVLNLNSSLLTWINNERFPIFMKFTHGNLPQLWKIDKFLAMAVVHENKIGSLKSDELAENYVDSYKFRDIIENVVRTQQERYGSYIQFGWTGTPDLANSIAMEKLATPSFLVVNTSSMIHYLPSESALDFTEETLLNFLDSIIENNAVMLGGDTYYLRVYRMYYNTKSSLEEMWTGNPVLTTVLFGLPCGFLSLICYSIWCSDILDADEDEPEAEQEKEKPHEKKD